MPEEILGQIHALEQALGRIVTELSGVVTELRALKKSDIRLRLVQRFLAISFGLDILVTALVGFGVIQARQASDAARQVQAKQIESVCIAGNHSRADELNLWTFVLALQPAQPPSDQQRQQTEQFVAYLHRAFAQRDCTKPQPFG